MNESFSTRRRLIMHSAHRAVGVSGNRAAIAPYGPLDDFSSRDFDLSEPATGDAETFPSAIASLSVVLVTHRNDANAQASAAMFEQILSRQHSMQCRRVEIEAMRFGVEDISEADCVIMPGPRLHIARRWADMEDAVWASQTDIAQPMSGRRIESLSEVTMEIAARWHPVLDGFSPFAMPPGAFSEATPPANATVLLTCQANNEAHPVAWVCGKHNTGVFGSLLGRAEDFRQPNFVRLVLNAMNWIASAE
jgi:hypothetical protein